MSSETPEDFASEAHRQMREYATALADYPHLVEVVGGYVAEAGYDYDAEFVFGLDVILDRLEQLLDQRRKRPPPAIRWDSAMEASPKTRPSDESAESFIAAVPQDARREDAQKLCGLLAEWTGEAPLMWGASIVGFGHYRYRYDSGREGTAPLVGFSPRKANLVLYLVGGVQDRYPKLLARLGPHKLGKG
jgi:hypothetical protein